MIEKPKKKRNQTLGYWQRKADKLLQEIGREMYGDGGCIVCGNEYSCLHHYVLKSHSTILRYNWKNLIPICGRCHYNHHTNKDSTVHARIDIIKGKEWIEEILALKKQGIGIKAGYTYYRNIYNNLKLIKPYKTKL